MTPEGRVKTIVKKALDAFFEKHWRFMPVQTGYGSPALDFILCINGWFVSIETKADAKAKLTPLQHSTKADIEAAGGIVLVVYDQPTCDRAMRIIYGICINGRPDAATEVPAQTSRLDDEHLRSQQQGETVAAPTRGHHGAPRTKPLRHAEPAASGDDQSVTATVRYFCPSCGGHVDHPSMLRSIPWCASPGCDVPMKQNPMTNGG